MKNDALESPTVAAPNPAEESSGLLRGALTQEFA